MIMGGRVFCDFFVSVLKLGGEVERLPALLESCFVGQEISQPHDPVRANDHLDSQCMVYLRTFASCLW